MIINLILWVILGAVAGWLASLVMRTDAEQGGLANVVIGIIGALIGGFLSQMLGGPGVSGFNFVSVIVATLGAIILLAILRLFRRSSHA
jgi:uncharacterized membrane protein YeaQ/YmgE (transglycosylase-associated protein family)